MQAKLLQVLQEQEIERVQDLFCRLGVFPVEVPSSRRINVRIVAASNRDLIAARDEVSREAVHIGRCGY